MKKTLSLILAVLLFLLPSCSKEGNDSPSVPSNPDAADSGEAGPAETEWPTPDYSDFVMPEETDSLVVYGYGFSSTMLSDAIGIFKKKYPDVAVDYRAYDEDEYTTVLQTEIPAGRGPDFVFGHIRDIPDTYKAMKTGLFEDLNPYLASDHDFDMNDYNRAVLDGGLMEGKRPILPLRYSLSMYITSQENLDDNGLSTEDFLTFDRFCDACLRYHDKNPANHLLQTGGFIGGTVYLRQLYLDFGFQLVDYQSERAAVDEEPFRRVMDLCSLWYGMGTPDRIDTSWSAVYNRLCLFLNMNTTDLGCIDDAYCLSMYGETPVFVSVPDPYGGMTAQIDYYGAIPVGAKNKLNGYRLLKILLSKEIQLGDENAASVWDITPTGYFGFPVQNPSLKRRLELIRELLPLYNPRELDEMPEVPEVITEQLYELTARVTRAVMLPPILQRYLELEMVPYLNGEKPWDDCYKRFLNTLVLYASE